MRLKPKCNFIKQSQALAALLATVLFTVLPARAAIVTLANGDRLSGEIVRLADNTLTFRSPIVGEIRIPWEQVQALESEQEATVQLRDGAILAAKLRMENDGRIQLDAGNDGASRSLARDQITALNPPLASPGIHYSGRLNVGGTFNRGNASSNQYSLIGELVVRRKDDRITLGAEFNEAHADGIETASNRWLSMQYDAFLQEKKFLFLNAKFTQDEPAALDLRTSLGAGYGYQFLDSDLAKLSAQLGLNYVHESYSGLQDESFPTLSVGMKYKRKLWNQKLEYFQNMEMDFNLDDTRDILARASFGLGLPVSKTISVNSQLNVDYDHQPAADKRGTDMALIFSVGYGF